MYLTRGEEKKRTVYLDSFTRNKYDEEIVVGREYTVYYEQKTKIILKFEENNQKVSKKRLKKGLTRGAM